MVSPVSTDGVPLLQVTDKGDGDYNSSSSSPNAEASCSKGKDTRWCRHKNWIRDARIRWYLLSKRSRLLIMVLVTFFLFHALVGISDMLFWKFNDAAPAISKASSFDVVINTFRRPQMLADAVRHYANTCGIRAGVNHVYIVWAEEGVTPPEVESFFRKSSIRQTKNRSQVTVLKVKNSLNSRFEPIEGGQDAVFMVDDDLRVNCRDLRSAFAAWKSHPNSLVGYYPRYSTRSRIRDITDLVYHSWPIVYWRDQLNIILTKACFLHKRYLAMYTSDKHPQEIKDFIDKHFNCEDIAMAMLVANVTRQELKVPARPIYVEGKVSDLGLFKGISTGTGHMTQRSDCLNELTTIYEKHGWKPPLEDSFSLTESSWLWHFPGFWWQKRPSNVFEWFALANAMK